MATGTVVMTSGGDTRTMHRISFDWLSDVAGDAVAEETDHVSGEVTRVVIVPDTGATTPDAKYSVYLYDADGIDILQGGGVMLSNIVTYDISPNGYRSITVGAVVYPGFNLWGGVGVDSKLNLVIADAGDQNGGVVTFYYR